MQHLAGEDAGGEMSMGKVAFASFIGAAIEFYDFYIYGTAAALVLGGAFFPTSRLDGGVVVHLPLRAGDVRG